MIPATMKAVALVVFRVVTPRAGQGQPFDRSRALDLDDAPRRLGVRPDVVAQPVRQRAHEDFGIHGHLLREGVLRDRLGRRLASGRSGLGGADLDRDDPGP